MSDTDGQFYVMFETLAGDLSEEEMQRMEEAFQTKPRKIIGGVYRISIPPRLAEAGTLEQKATWVQVARDRLNGDGSLRVTGIKGEVGTTMETEPNN